MQRQSTAVYVPFFILAVVMLLVSCDDDHDHHATTPPPQMVPTPTVEVVPRFEPTTCQQQLRPGSNTQCGYLVVPENRSKSNGKTIKLYITILKSDIPTNNEPVLYLTGGPGSETASAKQLFEQPGVYRAGFGGNRDIIVVDQRGTNDSLPALYCSQRPSRRWPPSIPRGGQQGLIR